MKNLLNQRMLLGRGLCFTLPIVELTFVKHGEMNAKYKSNDYQVVTQNSILENKEIRTRKKNVLTAAKC